MHGRANAGTQVKATVSPVDLGAIHVRAFSDDESVVVGRACGCARSLDAWTGGECVASGGEHCGCRECAEHSANGGTPNTGAKHGDLSSASGAMLRDSRGTRFLLMTIILITGNFTEGQTVSDALPR